MAENIQQNRPQGNNQQNRPQPIQQNSVITNATPVPEREVVREKHIDANNYTFKEVLGLLTKKVIDNEITPDQARRLLHTWYHSMNEEQRANFVSNRLHADEVVAYFRGLIDTFAQELPYLLTL